MIKFYYKAATFIFTCLILATHAEGQIQNTWKSKTESQLKGNNPRYIKPSKAQYYQLEMEALKADFLLSPAEEKGKLANYGRQIALPMPDGTFERFAFASYQMMEAELASKWNFVHTFVGQGLDNPSASCRVDFTTQGFHAMVLTEGSPIFIDPVFHNETEVYQVYFKSDLDPLTKGRFIEYEDEDGHGEAIIDKAGKATNGTAATGGTRREYRVAIAATGEYTTFHGGFANAASAITTTLNRVNGVYEKEVCIRLNLVANNNLLIYTNATSDPYTNGTAGTMLGQNQTNVTNVIGAANFDIGHVFGTNSGGVAGFGVVCSAGNKARGVTGSDAPVNDPFDIDYVAHEMGHQFGGSHTFNSVTSSCNGNREASRAYEPGSGTTIMAYAGICGADNIQGNSNAYFHFTSYEQITTFSVTGSGNSCAVKIATGNNAPTIPALASGFILPISTPFKLTAPVATDPDGDPITYCWEENDLGAGGAPNSPAGNAPIFRSFTPVSVQQRIFPRLSNILSNTTTIGERLPTYARNLNFKLTVRDNVANSGGVNSAAMTMTVNAGSGPFAVTVPNTAVALEGGSTQTITWSVANTASAPINCAKVSILLSTDGGQTFPIHLKDSVNNDGSESVILPVLTTTQARIMVESVGNVFFDISNANFQITAPVNSNATINTTSALTSFCAGQPFKIAIEPTGVTYLAGNIFSVQLSNAAGAFSTPVTIGTKAATGPDSITVTLPTNLASGTGYKIRVVASSPIRIGQSSTQTYSINSLPGSPGSITGPSGYCANAQNLLYKIAVQAGATSYSWTVPPGATIISNPDSNAVFVNMGTQGGNITARYSNTCGFGTNASTLPVSITAILPASVTISATPSGNICQGTSVTFNSTSQNGGTTPTYQWLKNDTAIQGAVFANYVSNTLAPGDKLKVILFSSNTCNAPNLDTSNLVAPNIIARQLPTAAITSNAQNDTTCEGNSVSFSSSITVGGTLPAYRWFKNGVAINNATASAYSGTFANNDTIRLRLTSSSSCIISNVVFSNPIIMRVFPLTVNAGADTQYCAGPQVQLLGQPTGGQWTGTGVSASGLFTETTPNSYALQYRVNKYGCSKADGKTVIIKALPTFSLGSDISVCETAIPFSINGQTGITCGGPAFVSGQFDPNIAGPGTTELKCTKTGTNGCARNDTVLITVTGVDTVFYSVDGNVLTANTAGANSYQWFADGAALPGATAQSLTITQNGVYCVETEFATGCKRKSDCQSQIFTSVANKMHKGVAVFPNPAGELIWIKTHASEEITAISVVNTLGQMVLKSSNTQGPIFVGQLPAGMYTVLVDIKGATPQKVVLVKY